MEIEGLPAHVLFVHLAVVLVPLTAVLLIVCSLWTAARTNLVWFISTLTGIVFFSTGLTIAAGKALAPDGMTSPTLQAHEAAGSRAWLVSLALVFATGFLIYLHKATEAINLPLRWILVITIIILSLWSVQEIHYIGLLGARSVWSSMMM